MELNEVDFPQESHRLLFVERTVSAPAWNSEELLFKALATFGGGSLSPDDDGKCQFFKGTPLASELATARPLLFDSFPPSSLGRTAVLDVATTPALP